MTLYCFLSFFVHNLHAWVRPWKIILALVLFIVIGISSAFETKTIIYDANAWHAVLLSFAGPSILGSSLTHSLRWLVPHILFFYLIGGIANEELLHRGYAILPLIGSRRIWWSEKISILLTLTTSYNLLWFLGVLLGAVSVLPLKWVGYPFVNSVGLWPFTSNITVVDILIWIFSLYISTLFMLTTVQITISVWWRRSFHAYIVIVVVVLLSWLLGTNQSELARWLPGSQSILFRHTFLDPSVSGFTLEWSLLYNIFVLLITFGYSFLYIRRLDIFGSSAADIR